MKYELGITHYSCPVGIDWLAEYLQKASSRRLLEWMLKCRPALGIDIANERPHTRI